MTYPTPIRGPRARAATLPVPPARMALARGGRPLKRWRYLGVYGPELMLCAGDAHIGPFRQRWWAVALPDGRLFEQTSMVRSAGVTLGGGTLTIAARGVRARLRFGSAEAVETLSPHGAQLIWTRKQAGVPVEGEVELEGRRIGVAARGVIDESAGYHARVTAWKWSAGVGVTDDGRDVGWNLVSGVHDDPDASERTLWVDGVPEHVPPVEFAPDLSSVAGLSFREWAARTDDTNVLLLRSRYRQPFGEFRGELPGGLRLARGWGVMEEHDVRW